MNNNHRLHFIGIGGISMSSLAAIAHRMGYTVTGSDRADSPLIHKLRADGITVNCPQSADNLGCTDGLTVVYTAAISPDNPELHAARTAAIPCLTRAQFLGQLMKDYNIRLGIAGTHGKSTTTAMTALIFEAAGMNPTVVNGAVMREYDGAYKVGGKDCFVFEACEYTDSFLSFYPTTAVITNVDFDHPDYFHSVGQYTDSFAKYISLADTAVVNLDSPNSRAAIEHYDGNLITCSLTAQDAMYTAADVELKGGFASYTLTRGGEKLCRVGLSVPGMHNLSDSLVAAASAIENGCPPDAVVKGLESFKGIKRRLELICTLDGARLFDDYAHHPSEIKTSLAALKGLGGRIICVFQPHSVSRTVELFDDFTRSFGDADEVIFADIYENLEHDTGGSGLTSADLSKRVPNSRYIKDFTEIAKKIKADLRSGDIVVTMGAGDIFKVGDLLRGLYT